MKRIAILGSTGSIGRSTLNVIENHPERFQLVTMAAGVNIGPRALTVGIIAQPHDFS